MHFQKKMIRLSLKRKRAIMACRLDPQLRIGIE